jgi:3-oxoacyl-[acyl-carrier protein] reductase
MKSISREVARYHITVNALLPGYTHTKRLEDFGISLERLAEQIPAGRLAEPKEMGALAAFLASMPAAYITGQAIACDGGLIAGL